MSYAYYLAIFNYLCEEYVASGILSQTCWLQGRHGNFYYSITAIVVSHLLTRPGVLHVPHTFMFCQYFMCYHLYVSAYLYEQSCFQHLISRFVILCTILTISYFHCSRSSTPFTIPGLYHPQHGCLRLL
jgi:hypothetical protein